MAEEEVARLNKWLRAFITSSGRPAPVALRPQYEDLVQGKLSGPWWEQGVRLDPVVMAALEKRPSGRGAKGAGLVQEVGASGAERDRLLALAAKNKIGGEIRRAVFMVMMGAEDYQDAAEKLVNLNLNETQVRYFITMLCLVHYQYAMSSTLSVCY